MVTIRNKEQKARFIAVGAANTLLDFGLLFLLRSLGLPAAVANIFSTTTAFCVSFVANKKVTFKGGGENVIREMILFTVVTLFGLWVIQTLVIGALMPVFSDLLNSANYGLFAAKLVATGVTLIWNYALYSRIVFKK